MGGILGLILSTLVSAILPILLNFIKGKLPTATRAEARQWVVDMLTEFVKGLNAHGLVPSFLQVLESPVEALFASVIDAGLDKAGW